MRLALIDFYIRNQKLSKIGPKLVADSINYVDCSFTFRTDDWNGIDKWVVFSKGGESYLVNLVDDSIPEETGLNLGAGLWFVSLFGENAEGTKRITTNSVTVEVAKSAVSEGGPLPAIGLSEAEQIAAKAQKALDTANEVLLKAKNGDFDGLPGKTPNIQIGEVLTLEPGTEATASITGTAEEPRLNLGIPKGEPGEGGGGNAEVTAESIEAALGYVPANPKDIPKVPTNVSAFNNDAGYAKTSELPTKTSELSNDSGYITKEDIPAAPEVPVKSVNGKTGAVQLNAADVGARPSTWLPTPEEIGAKPSSYSPNYEDVGADKAGKAAEEVGKHNTSENAHNDIRVELTELRNALEAFLDIDDPTLDQLSELIQKIEANAGTIEQLTNGKVNVSDIVNNLTTNVANKPLSAAQGVVLKELVDELDTIAKDAASTAIHAKTTANEAKSLATAADTNAKNAVDTVNNMQERMDSGEFKGETGKTGPVGPQGIQGNPGTPGTDGKRGTGILKVTTSTTSASGTGDNGEEIKYKIALATIKSEAGVDEVFVGDTVLRSYYTYHVVKVDSNYVYLGAYTSIRGSQGSAGTNATITSASATVDDNVGTPSVEVSMGGTASARSFIFTFKNLKGKTGATGPQGPAYTLTEADKAEIVRLVHESIGTPIFGVVEENNNIILSGNLADGTYSIKYEMDGSTIDIGDLVLDSNTYYSVTNNLTNCTNSNSATEVVEGGSYSATITANSGYELKSVTVTMGGAAVSVTNGVINIASVTGNIVITAVAEEVVEEVRTNFCVPLGDGWISGGRCSSGGDDREDSEAFALTNYISVQNGDFVEVENLAITTTTYSGLYKADASKTAIGGFKFVSSGAVSGYVKDINLTANGGSFTIDNANAGYIRICGEPTQGRTGVTGTSNFEDKYIIDEMNIIVNIKRNGEWL